MNQQIITNANVLQTVVALGYLDATYVGIVRSCLHGTQVQLANSLAEGGHSEEMTQAMTDWEASLRFVLQRPNLLVEGPIQGELQGVFNSYAQSFELLQALEAEQDVHHVQQVAYADYVQPVEEVVQVQVVNNPEPVLAEVAEVQEAVAPQIVDNDQEAQCVRQLHQDVGVLAMMVTMQEQNADVTTFGVATNFLEHLRSLVAMIPETNTDAKVVAVRALLHQAQVLEQRAMTTTMTAPTPTLSVLLGTVLAQPTDAQAFVAAQADAPVRQEIDLGGEDGDDDDDEGFDHDHVQEEEAVAPVQDEQPLQVLPPPAIHIPVHQAVFEPQVPVFARDLPTDDEPTPAAKEEPKASVADTTTDFMAKITSSISTIQEQAQALQNQLRERVQSVDPNTAAVVRTTLETLQQRMPDRMAEATRALQHLAGALNEGLAPTTPPATPTSKKIDTAVSSLRSAVAVAGVLKGGDAGTNAAQPGSILGRVLNRVASASTAEQSNQIKELDCLLRLVSLDENDPEVGRKSARLAISMSNLVYANTPEKQTDQLDEVVVDFLEYCQKLVNANK